MMKITQIKKCRKYLSSIYIDGEFAVKLDSRTVLEEGIAPGDEIDDETLREYIELSDFRRAKEKALWLISSRDHSRKELIDKIAVTVPRESAELAADRMEELGLINDEAFAERYARELSENKHLAQKGIKYKLIQKGIDKDLAEEIIEQLEIDPQQNIRAVIEKKYAKNLSDEKGKRRCVMGLQRLGYSYSDINSVIREYIEDEY
ncbi:recombination regulator RecX [bacterium]|nr:recombination regulator RecX [bacterium]MDY3861521.1 regulatory protein RecX [Ruminococcus sp.]